MHISAWVACQEPQTQSKPTHHCSTRPVLPAAYSPPLGTAILPITPSFPCCAYLSSFKAYKYRPNHSSLYPVIPLRSRRQYARSVQPVGLLLFKESLSRFLEKEMATYSSILAWKIPRTEEPGGWQFMRSQRVRHDWATSLHFSLFHSSLILFRCLFLKDMRLIF